MGCNKCKNYVFADLKRVPVHEPGFTWFDTVEVPRHCGKGCNAIFENWWTVNGPKPAGTIDENPPECFEPHESDVRLDNLLRMTDELLTMLKTDADAPEFAEGDAVLYIPNHSSGDRSDPANERGVVSKVEGSGLNMKVWVRYSTGSTGALTPLKNLVKA